MLQVLIYSFFVFVFGLCIGSFLNVVILRAFSGESIVLPPSKCPNCKEKIKWYDNIPLLSYLILKGQCRNCKTKISIQYPIVEFATGLIWFLIFFKFGLSVSTLLLLILASLGIVIATTDIKEKVVFDVHTISFIIIAMIYRVLTNATVEGIFGLIAGALIMEILARLGYLFVKRRAFGEGDTYIAAGIGALFGVKLFIIILVLSVVLQVVCILPNFLSNIWKEGEKSFVASFLIFIVSTFIYKLLLFKHLLSKYSEYAFVAVIVASGVFSCVKLLKAVKKKNEFNYLPFGPSMLFVSLMMVLWSNYIIQIVQKMV